jgi:3-dehydroquinate dehydratase-2
MTTTRNRVQVLHGVNLDMLGGRDKLHYGDFTLPELEVKVRRFARELNLEAAFFDSNSEGEFVEHIHRLPELADAAIVNAGAWTHYSYAIRDALEVCGLPAVEIHISEVDSRDDWRRKSVIRDICVGRIQGKGADGYRDALELLRAELDGR